MSRVLGPLLRGTLTLLVACAAFASPPAGRGVVGSARAETSLPPWTDATDLPLPTWARSVVPRRAEVPVAAAFGKPDAHRGTLLATARLPLFGAKRAAGCNGRWLLVGPLAWVCSDLADLSPDLPRRDESAWASASGPDGLPFRYFYVGQEGASGFLDLSTALESSPDQEYDAGFVVAVAEQKTLDGEAWGRTNHGKWIAMRELSPVRPPLFYGREVEGELDFAWVVADRAEVRVEPRAGAPSLGRVAPRRVVRVREVRKVGAIDMARVSTEGLGLAPRKKGGTVPEEGWMLAREIARPTLADPPSEASPDERWIDVDRATQTLVAYEGKRPVYATLVSTGRGPEGSETATPPGAHRVWVKLTTTNMDNLERDDADEHYSIEDVPYVQFFDKGVALHGAFWHDDFGHVHSHGCVNLAPVDARWLFGFTGPHLPAGYSAVFPTSIEPGTLVRVR